MNNQHSEIRAFNDKTSRRNNYNKKKENKRCAAKKRAIALKEKEQRKEESQRKLDSQGGFLPTQRDLLAYLPGVAGIDTDRIVSEIENVTALYTSLREAQSSLQAASIIFLYLKTHCSGSVLNQAVEFIRTECDFNLLDTQDSEAPEWLQLIKRLKSDWLAVSHNKAFKKISTLLSMSAAMGLCDLSNMKFDINGIRVFSVPAYKQHVNASDFFGAIFDTFTYFIEGGYKCFKEGSLTPFIFSGDEAMQFEQDYFEMLDLAPFMKAGNLLTKKNITENDFDFKLNKIIDKADALYKASEGTWEKKVLFDRLTQLRKIRAEFISVRVDGKLREAPFAIYIEGPSGVGKSSVSAILMRVVLLANGFDASDERLITLNEADKYMSTYRSHINGIFIDDLGNTQAAFVEKSPVEKVIEMVNNVPAYANMAEADLKGKVSIEPHCLVGTSNIPIDVIARQYSNEAYSIDRRFPVQLYVTVKEEFAMEDGRLDSSKVHAHYPDGIPPVPDLWNIEVFEPFFDARNSNRRSKGIFSIMQVIKLCKKMSRTHFKNQKDVVTFASNLDEKLDFCDRCHLPGCMCKCEKELDNQMFEQSTEYVRNLVHRVQEFDSPWLRWTNYVPDYLFDNHGVDAFLAFLNRHNIYYETLESCRAWKGSLILGLISLMWSAFLSIFIVFGSSFLYARQLYRTKSRIIRQLRDANGAMPEIFKRIRDNHVATIAVTGSILGVLYVAIRAYRHARLLGVQAGLDPKTAEEVAERDSEVNPWAGVEVTIPHSTVQSQTCSHDELCASTFKNLHYCSLEDSKTRRFCDAFFWKSNLAILPSHMISENEIVGTFWRRAEGTNGAYFKSNLSSRFSYKIPGTDYTAFWVPNTWSVKDMTPFIAQEVYNHSVPTTMVYKTLQGERKDFKFRANPGTVCTKAATFKGYNYILQQETFNGLCMAALVSNSVKKQILGFHLGGLGTEGGAGAITVDMLNAAEAALRQREGILVAKSQGTVLTNQYGEEFYQGPQIHDKSPTRFLPEGTNIDVFGSVTGRVTTYSNVVPTVISPIVEEVCGVPQQWGKPKFNNPSWRPWQASLEHSSRPSIGMEGDLLQNAVIDYKLPLLKLIETREDIRENVRPLARMQTVCGIDGMRFIDKMKPSTSVGFPLAGPKSEYLTLLDPEEYEDFACPTELDDQFWDEFERMKSEYLAGRRSYPVFKASLKDEPTSLSKDKVRVFQAAPLALQLAVRMYFLPIVRVLSLFPLVSECAVGINAQGPEWDELAKYVKQYGADRILAGDYSKYDLRMSCQLMSAAFRILIDLAKASGNYTEEDISIMGGIASDICQPLMAYNGDYIQHVGSNPSGQNLTVYINSIVNSLLFRCAFYHICKDRKKTTFRDVCSLITYGDDAKSSVKEGWDEFNHISVANFLAERDMKFTMPDKESEPTPYMTDEDADLLKRKNVFNKETGLIFGALDEKSIFKSLHSVLRSKAVTNEEQCMSNIDGALREWFSHGREVYESRRMQMKEVADRANLTYGCRELDVSYDEALDRFSQKYGVPLLEPCFSRAYALCCFGGLRRRRS